MCVTVVVGDIDPIAPKWDRDQVAVVIGPNLDYFTALRQVRAMLIYLGAPQLGIGATCWCGDYVAIWRQARVPEQRTTNRQEARHAP